MAKAVANGISSVGVDIVVKRVEEAKVEEAGDFDAILLGSPNQMADIAAEMKKFINKLKEVKLNGKVGGAFGSYGTEGVAVMKMQEEMKTMKMRIMAPGPTARLTPSEMDLAKCREFGRKIAETLRR